LSDELTTKGDIDMKFSRFVRLLVLGLVLCFVFLSFTVANAQAQKSSSGQIKTVKPKHYKQLQYPPLRELKIPEPTRFELANGMVVYMLEDHSLPTIRASVMVHAGSRYEPADKVGLASLTGQVMRTGGTTTRTGDELDSLLERVAASVETYIGTSSGGASLSVMKEDFDLGLSVLADVLKNPAFRDDKIELAKITERSVISRRNDEVSGIAAREFNRLIYGPDHPYGRITEYATIENIAKEDMIDFHKKYFVPNNMMISIWGDFSTNEVRKKIEQVLGTWERQNVEFPPVPELKIAVRKSVNFIKKEDVNQSNIYLGHLGGKLNDPEATSLNLANQAFGGAFASRLFKHVRSDQGLAYYVGSYWGENYDYPGVFEMSGSTKSGSTVKMILSIQRELEDLVKNGITEEELKFAKDMSLNSFVFRYDTKGKIINQLMSLEFYGYPKDFIQKQQKEIQTATRKSVSEAIRNRWNPEAITLLVVGKDKDFDEPLSVLSTSVQTIEIAIPAPPEKIPSPTPETISKGKEILQKTLAAIGGKAVLGIKDVVDTRSMTVNTPQGEMKMDVEMAYLEPNRVSQKIKLPFGEMAMVFDGTKGWVKSPMGVQDMPGSQIDELKHQLAGDINRVLQHFEQPDYAVQYLKDETVSGKTMQVVFVAHTPTNSKMRFFIDPQTNLVAKKMSRGNTAKGPADVEEIYEDYRVVDGVQVPFKMAAYAGGEKTLDITINTMKINSGVKEDTFKRP
jgi:predicted Zn-dependent peptidase/outer membrane lipoprotein-sorting protein